ncbi:hypothetical protein [Enterococcus mundtii]|uniref:hypothetical protein n=1 Tax=Enterococcus mundtii TaxID=53346 RepID=UPI0035C77EB0
MNEQQLKEMITSMLSEMVAGEKTIEQPKSTSRNNKYDDNNHASSRRRDDR